MGLLTVDLSGQNIASVFERRAARVLMPLLIVVPAVLYPAAVRIGERELLPPLAVEIFASSLNVLLVVAFIWVGLLSIRRDRAALHAVEQRLELAIEAHSVSIFEWNIQTGGLAWNPGGEQRLGVPTGSMTSADIWARHVNHEDAAIIFNDVAIAGDHKRDRFTFRYRFSKPDGEVRQIAGSARLLYDPRGELFTAIGVNVDVTEQERDQAQLASIVNTVPEAMIVIDACGVIKRFSKNAEHMFGWLEADMIGHNIARLMPPRDGEQHGAYLDRYLKGGVPKVIGRKRRLAGLRADGTEFPMELAVGEAWAAGERIFTGFIRDISDRVAAESRIEELRAESSHADRLNAMGEVAAGLAHELNQPLAAAANYMSVAEVMAPAGEGALLDAARNARTELMRAGAIIRRLRDFLEKNDAETGSYYIKAIVEDAVALSFVGRDKSRIAVETRGDCMLRVLADRIQIQQILVNLIRNAAEAATLDGCGTIEIGWEARGNGLVEISVSDDGPGIPDVVLERLYEPFVSTKRERGMGVGLSICRRIVEAHGGVLAANNRPHGGARLSFSLPLADKEGL